MNECRSRLAFAVAAAFAGTGLTAGMPGVASAQQVSSISSGLEEVVVSAQRRDQVLQDVPITIQVVGNELLERRRGRGHRRPQWLRARPGDLERQSDAAALSRSAASQTVDFGVGTDSAVGVYVDGVYSSRTGSSLLAFNDIERIEVLKGPQGTLFGRNSAAGAISIVTRKPVDEFDAFLRLRRRRVRQDARRWHGQRAAGRQSRAARQWRVEPERRLGDRMRRRARTSGPKTTGRRGRR